MFTNRGNLLPKGQILDQLVALDQEKVKILCSVIQHIIKYGAQNGEK
jgi:hypothetical protein